jgi:hypothetical protein
MDDEEAGSFWDRLQDRVLGASVRTVVSRLAWETGLLLTWLSGPCESAVNLAFEIMNPEWLFAIFLHIRKVWPGSSHAPNLSYRVDAVVCGSLNGTDACKQAHQCKKLDN